MPDGIDWQLRRVLRQLGHQATDLAAKAVAGSVTAGELNQGLLYPLQSEILENEIKTAARVAKLVFDSGLARAGRPPDIEFFILGHLYKPDYAALA